MACVSTTVHVQEPSGADLAALHTFAWDGGRVAAEEGFRVDRAQIDRVVREACVGALARKGYTPASPSAADLRVSYSVVIEAKAFETTMRDFSDYQGGRLGQSPREVAVVHRYDEGTLAIELHRGDSGALAWRGWLEAEVHRAATPNEREERIRVAVMEIIDRLPPAEESSH